MAAIVAECLAGSSAGHSDFDSIEPEHIEPAGIVVVLAPVADGCLVIVVAAVERVVEFLVDSHLFDSAVVE